MAATLTHLAWHSPPVIGAPARRRDSARGEGWYPSGRLGHLNSKSECISGVGATVRDRRAVAVSARGDVRFAGLRPTVPAGGWGFPCVPHLTATGDVRVPTWRSAFPGRCATFPGGVCAETWTTRLVWVIAAAALRAAVPDGGAFLQQLGGRRSLACAPPFPAGVRAETGVIRELGDTWFARLSAGGAGPHREDCPEVGVPLPARRSFPEGYVPRRASYGNWAIRGSPAFRRAVPGPTGRTAQRSAFPCRCAVTLGGGAEPVEASAVQGRTPGPDGPRGRTAIDDAARRALARKSRPVQAT